MDILLLSGGSLKENKAFSVLKEWKSKNIVFIPAWYDEKENHKDFLYYSEGIKAKLFSFKNPDLNLIKSADTVVLMGGNTFYLAKKLKELNLKSILKKKKLMGISAGSIVLTKSLGLANYPRCSRDHNSWGKQKSLNLLNFEIYPHFSGLWQLENKELAQYKNKGLIFLMKDGDFILIKNSKIHRISKNITII